MHSSLVLLLGLLMAAGNARGAPTDSCDLVWSEMVDVCKSLRSSLLKITQSGEPKPSELCCAKVRFGICVSDASGLAAIAKQTQIFCPPEFYDSTISQLDSSLPERVTNMTSDRCEGFDNESCFHHTKVDTYLARVKRAAAAAQNSTDLEPLLVIRNPVADMWARVANLSNTMRFIG